MLRPYPWRHLSIVEGHRTMRDNGTFHHRRSIRLKGHDYTRPGAYSFDIVTHRRICMFGHVRNARVVLTRYGEIVQRVWTELPRHFDNIALDAFVVMPNHVHGVVMITGAARAALGIGESASDGDAGGHKGEALPPSGNASPLRDVPPVARGTVPGSLPAIVQTLKSLSTRRINQARGTPGGMVWQRNYYEHIIRDERELAARRRYIEENPRRWEEDPHHRR